MRLDKYLKTARILKRRTVSKELADQQRVYAALMFDVLEEKIIKKDAPNNR